jgi:putative transposase
VPTPEIARLTESTEWIDLKFVKVERTSREIIEKRIRHYHAELSLLNTVIILDDLGVNRNHVAVYNWE